MDSDPQERQHFPNFGGSNGLLYPLVARVLYYATSIAPPRCFNLSTSQTDLYLVGCFALILAMAMSVRKTSDEAVAYLAAAIALWRLLETASVILFEFCIRSYRGRRPNAVHRVLILKLINLAELIVAFGILYYLPGRFGLHWMNRDFDTMIDAIYFSTVTALTLGYGDYTPTHPLLKLLAMFQLVFFVLIAVTVLSAFRSNLSTAPTSEPSKS
jgi:hypothetical protein